ncbi:MAG: V-type ATP synthase subunit F [Candidatus Diapherotrites archaeon]
MSDSMQKKEGQQLQITVLGSKNTVTGFKLAGIKKTIVAEENPQALLRQFETLTADPSTGILIIDNSCSPIKKEIFLFIEANKNPIIIEIPDKTGKKSIGITEHITKKASGSS